MLFHRGSVEVFSSTSNAHSDFFHCRIKRLRCNGKLQRRQNSTIDSLTADCLYDCLDYDSYFLGDLILKVPLQDLILVISKLAKSCQKP